MKSSKGSERRESRMGRRFRGSTGKSLAVFRWRVPPRKAYCLFLEKVVLPATFPPPVGPRAVSHRAKAQLCLRLLDTLRGGRDMASMKDLRHAYDATRGLWCIDRNPAEVDYEWIKQNAFQLENNLDTSNVENVVSIGRFTLRQATEPGKI